MALDEALMQRARERDEAVLRVYTWSRPTLSLGRHQTARGHYDLARAAALGIDFVRRPTGGRAVLHHREVTYSVTAPAGMLGSPRESYHRINRLLLDGLRRLGVRAGEAVGTARPPRPGVAPCFETPVAGEIVAGHRKLVGSAQVHEHGALLQHGAILLEDDQPLAAAILVSAHARGAGARAAPPVTLAELLGRTPTVTEVAEALFGALDDATSLPLEAAVEETARALRARYEDPDWTWRR